MAQWQCHCQWAAWDGPCTRSTAAACLRRNILRLHLNTSIGMLHSMYCTIQGQHHLECILGELCNPSPAVCSMPTAKPQNTHIGHVAQCSQLTNIRKRKASVLLRHAEISASGSRYLAQGRATRHTLPYRNVGTSGGSCDRMAAMASSGVPNFGATAIQLLSSSRLGPVSLRRIVRSFVAANELVSFEGSTCSLCRPHAPGEKA